MLKCIWEFHRRMSNNGQTSVKSEEGFNGEEIGVIWLFYLYLCMTYDCIKIELWHVFVLCTLI